MGPGRRAHRAPARQRRLRDLHAGQPRRAPGVDPRVVQRAGRSRARGHRADGRSGDDDGDERADAARRRRRSGAEPRAHPAVGGAERRLVQGREPRPRRDHPPHPAAAVHARRRPRPRGVLPREGSLRAGDARQRPAGRAELRAVAGRRAARHRHDALHAGGQAARGDRLGRAPVRPGADVLPDAAPQPRRQLDALAIGHVEPARDAVSRRSRRLHAAGRQPAVEAGAAAADEAGARVRPRRGAGDAEPDRHRLQGPVERRHVVPRPAADGARQGAAARRARGRAQRAGRDVRSRRDGAHPVLAAEADVLPARRPRGRAGDLPDALGDVLPARAADEGSDQAAVAARGKGPAFVERGPAECGGRRRRRRGGRTCARVGRHARPPHPKRRRLRFCRRRSSSSSRRPGRA